MGYVDSQHSALDTEVKVIVRGREVNATVSAMPFIPSRYYVHPKKKKASKKAPPTSA